MEQVKRLGVETTLQSFFITGFNGLILGLQSRITYRVSESMGRLMIRKYPISSGQKYFAVIGETDLPKVWRIT
jgi:hypothetical protein